MKNSTNLPQHAQEEDGMQRLSDKVSYLDRLREQDKDLYSRQISLIKSAIGNNEEHDGFSHIQLKEILMQLEVNLGYRSIEINFPATEIRESIEHVASGRSFSN